MKDVFCYWFYRAPLPRRSPEPVPVDACDRVRSVRVGAIRELATGAMRAPATGLLAASRSPRGVLPFFLAVRGDLAFVGDFARLTLRTPGDRARGDFDLLLSCVAELARASSFFCSFSRFFRRRFSSPG